MPRPRRAMGPFSFHNALVVLSCFVLCTLSLLALWSSSGSQLGTASLLISEAKLALSRYGGNNFKGLESIRNHAPTLSDVRLEDYALANSSQKEEARTSERRKSGKLLHSSQSVTTQLLSNRNSSSGLSWMHRGTNRVSEVGLAGAETPTSNLSAEPVALTHATSENSKAQSSPRYLYWGPEIDHPNAVCSGFNHQTVSLVCALSEALATGRTFILPSHICISQRHRGLPQLEKADKVQERGVSSSQKASTVREVGSKLLGKERKEFFSGEGTEGQSVDGAVGASSHSWAELESLIDVVCVNKLVPVVLNTSAEVRGFLNQWEAQSGGDVGTCFNTSSSEVEPKKNQDTSKSIQGVSHQLEVPSKGEASNEFTFLDNGGRAGVLNGMEESSQSVCVVDGRVKFADVAPWNASELLVRTRPSGMHFPWFEVCKQGSYKKRIWRSTLFPKCFAEPLHRAASKMQATIGDYDAVHVRRGDKLTGSPSRHWPHLARDTSPSAIRARLSEWISAGRSVYVASNEANQSFFEELRRDFKVFRPSDFSSILRPVMRNEYQLYIVENLVLRGATTFVATFKEDDMLGHNTSHFLAEDASGGVPRGSKESHV